MKISDYIYCNDCKMFSDFWKYDHDINDVGHKGCHWRYITQEELDKLVENCQENGCFTEIRI